MTSVAAVRQGIATNVATISGLRTFAYLRDQVPVPAATVGVQEIIYDLTMGGGFTGTFLVRLYVGKATDKHSQDKLDDYLDDDGAESVKGAIESDLDLGGALPNGTLRVTRVGDYGVYEVGGIDYLGAEFTVTVWTTGS